MSLAAAMSTMQASPDALASRPKVASAISFSRFEASSSSSQPTSLDTSRARASTLSGTTAATGSPMVSSPQSALPSAVDGGEDGDDIFASKDDVLSPTVRTQESFEELPIEIRSLTERFLKDLTAPVHSQPVTVDTLSDLFQEFYTKVESHIAAHIATLSLKIGRERSPAPSRSNTKSAGAGTATPTRKVSAEQQMLTASEVTDRKKARRQLELKKTAWEETVERTVVEKVYSRIYRHRSTDDEERDHKLRSRIAALSLVGIGLKELLSGANEIPDDMRQKTVEEQDRIRNLLAGARQNIQNMDTERSPLGKLQHLALAHKSIVETLSQLFPSTSSADEILPTLIYALMTMEPASVNVVSNLKFIQRFRAASKVDGEAAYCLVNLEAATAFLETVDLASLRASEAPSGPSVSKNVATNRPVTPRINSAPMDLGVEPASDPAASGSSSPGTKPPPSPTSKQSRRLSNLISNSTNRFNEASDSFRGAVLDGADTAFDTIQNTLNSSFNLLFGRLREHQAQSGNDAVSQDVLPKTLEDARKLVSTPPQGAEEEGDASSIVTSSTIPDGEDPLSKPVAPSNERVSELFGGRRQMRDRSVDSHHSGSSAGKRVAFDGSSSASQTVPNNTPASSSNAAIEGMRNFGNTINPLNQLSRMGGLFGRSGSIATPPASTPPTVIEKPLLGSGLANRSRSSSDAKALSAVQELKKMAPPSKKFIECKDVRDLRVGELEELLKEYQRIVRDVGKIIASV
ncbi:uncharacterized protein PV09_01361 [Verruconis gallopava]|uniref:VPS9 domain-containing protein n=1 Tax=Verruconis gallopava TaxID=253628 RepID=A0A0D2AP55_9PEZI|nr:uncharacterized protein PV09_01361 [Verruconis gallopava]KIW08458.1 hypothetical protein PV09_01361 [Verruconis gallopava]